VLATAAAVAALALGACGDGGNDTKPGASAAGIDVVANFYPMADAAARVGGNRVKVTNLTPTGTEPHDIELTSRQVDGLQDADLVVYLGKGFQPAVAEIASRRTKGRLDVTEGVGLHKGAIDAIEAEEGGGGSGATPETTAGSAKASGLDPHFWLDPTLMAKAVDEIAGALAEVSPGNAATFRTNAQRYKGELRALDTQLKAGLAHCDRSEIVTSHAAFFYLARRYGLTQVPIAGLSPEAEPNADRLATLADEIKAKGITTVFYEDLVSPRVSDALAREAGVKTAVLSPIEGLTKDDLDAGKNYVAVMRDNLAALRQALGCR
jgi:zinc transport system substrate-binding protein